VPSVGNTHVFETATIINGPISEALKDANYRQTLDITQANAIVNVTER
jgi:hypothetical protein